MPGFAGRNRVSSRTRFADFRGDLAGVDGRAHLRRWYGKGTMPKGLAQIRLDGGLYVGIFCQLEGASGSPSFVVARLHLAERGCGGGP